MRRPATWWEGLRVKERLLKCEADILSATTGQGEGCLRTALAPVVLGNPYTHRQGVPEHSCRRVLVVT